MFAAVSLAQLHPIRQLDHYSSSQAIAAFYQFGRRVQRWMRHGYPQRGPRQQPARAERPRSQRVILKVLVVGVLVVGWVRRLSATTRSKRRLTRPKMSSLTRWRAPARGRGACSHRKQRASSLNCRQPSKKLAEKVLKVLKPSLGEGVSNHVQSWASSYVALRLDAKAEGAAFEQDCLRLLQEGCERAAKMAIPPLRQWAIGWLPNRRSGQFRAYHDDVGPAVVVFPAEVKLDQAPVEVFGVLGVATEKGDQCGNERDQCLPLSFAAAFPDVSPEQVLGELQIGARSAEQTFARLSQKHPDRMPSAEAAYANSAAHDLSAGHSHDAHFALYFWPKRLRNVVFVLVKLADRGVMVIDTMDLREKGQKSPVVHFVLMVDGHARPLHFPASWNEGLEGLSRFLLAARNRNVMVNEFQFVGWQCGSRRYSTLTSR